MIKHVQWEKLMAREKLVLAKVLLVLKAYLPGYALSLKHLLWERFLMREKLLLAKEFLLVMLCLPGSALMCVEAPAGVFRVLALLLPWCALSYVRRWGPA